MLRAIAILVLAMTVTVQAGPGSRTCLANARKLFGPMPPTPQRYTTKNGSWAYLETGERYQFVLGDGRRVDGHPFAAKNDGAIAVNPINPDDPNATVSLDVLEDVVEIFNSKSEAILRPGFVEVPASITSPNTMLQTNRVYRWHTKTGQTHTAVLVGREGDSLVLRHGGKPWDLVEAPTNGVFRIDADDVVIVEIIGDSAQSSPLN